MTELANIEARLNSLSATVSALAAAPAARSYDDRALIGEIESLKSELAEMKSGNREAMSTAVSHVQNVAKEAAKAPALAMAKQSVNLICEIEDKLEGKIRSAKAETEERLNAAKNATSKFEMLAEIQAQTASAHIIKYLAGRI